MADTFIEVHNPAGGKLHLRLIDNGDGTHSFATSQAALSPSVDFVGLAPDAGTVASTIVTTHATPGTDTVIDIPDTARGFILEPTGSLVRWRVNAAAAAVGSGNTLGNGGRAKADTEIVRLLPMLDENGDALTGRTLHLRSLVASVVCYVEYFG